MYCVLFAVSLRASGVSAATCNAIQLCHLCVPMSASRAGRWAARRQAPHQLLLLLLFVVVDLIHLGESTQVN